MSEIRKISVDGIEYDIEGPVSSVNNKTGAVTLTASDVGAYVKPSSGVPKTDLADDVQESIAKADSAYQQPTSGIPKSALNVAVQMSLGKADSALQSVPNTYRTASDQDTIDAGKISMPSGGTTGQFLQKTSSGTQWATPSGGGGGGTSDYDDLSNKPQIAGTTLSGNKSLADLGIAAASDIPTVPSASSSNPANLGNAASPGSSTEWARGDHVHKKPSASDIGAAPAWGEDANDDNGAVTQAIPKNTLFDFVGTLTSLTITLADGLYDHYHFRFTAPTAITLTMPASVTMPDNFTVEAGKFYEVDIFNAYAVVQSWTAS